jgi:hypothetical protein
MRDGKNPGVFSSAITRPSLRIEEERKRDA